MKTYLLLLILAVGQVSFGAPNPRAGKEQVHKFISEGSFRGGIARPGNSFSIAQVKRVVSPSKRAERLVFEMAGARGQKIVGNPGFFQGQVRDNPPRITIDFAQTPLTKFNQKRLAGLFKKSNLVKNVSLAFDPADQTTTVTLNLKGKAQARVYSLGPKNNSPKVVLDLTLKK